MNTPRLRKLNASHGPVNTLSSSKRSVAKLSGEHALIGSFAQSTAVYSSNTDDSRSPFFVLDTDQPEGNRTDGIPQRTKNIRKAGSSGPRTSIPKYRRAQPETLSHKGRFRRSRLADSSVQTRGSWRGSTSSVSKDLGTISSPSTARNVIVESPDILTENPITSPVVHDSNDLQNSKKRTQSAYGNELQEPSSKRLKQVMEPIDDPENELGYDPQQNLYTSTFSLRQPGDSMENKRQLVLKSLKANPHRWTRQYLIIKRAVSGKQLYDTNDMSLQQIALLPAPNDSPRLVPTVVTTSNIAAQSWLGIDLYKVLRLQYARGCSSAILERSSSHDVPGKLFVEFESGEGPQTLVDFFSDSRLDCCGFKLEPWQPQVMEKKVKIAMIEAQKYNARQSNMNNGSVLSSENDQDVETSRLSTLRSANQGFEFRRRRPEDMTDEIDKLPAEAFRGSSTAQIERSFKNVYGSRRTRRSPPFLLPHPARYDLRWTETHLDWRASWKKSLIYPATGKNRTTIDADDIPRLDEGEFLNDNVISFYLRFLQLQIEKERPHLSKRVYIFSTFFFEKLRSTKGKINYEGVKAWTAKVDLFAYDYIVVPVNERAHWYLAIICNARNALIAPACEEDTDTADHITRNSVHDSQKSPSSTVKDIPPAEPLRTISPSPIRREIDSKQPKIIILDSLQTAHPATCKALKEYLVEEARSRKCLELATVPQGYVKEFLVDPDEVTRKLLQRETLALEISPSCIRNQIRDLIFDLQRKQVQEEQTKRQEQSTPRQDTKDQALAHEQIVDSSPPFGRLVVSTDEAVVLAPDDKEKAKVLHSVQNCPHQPNEDERGHLGQSMECLSIHDALPATCPASNERVDVFYSAPSTPKDAFIGSERAGLEAIEDRKTCRSTRSSLSHNSEPKLIDLLPSSSSAGEQSRPDRVMSARPRQAPAGVTNKRTMQKSWPPTRDKLVTKLSSSPSPAARRGAASDDNGMKNNKRAGYDGIDRTLDLT